MITRLNDTILSAVEPDVSERIVSRRDAILKGASAAAMTRAAMMIGSVPAALAALSRYAGPQTTSVTDVLNFALMLEMFENEFYKAVLGTSASAAQNAAFTTVRTAAAAVAGAVPALRQIQKHEQQHVEFRLANGATNQLGLSATSFAVEARHVSKIRRMRRATGAPIQVRYAGYVQGDGLQAAGISNLATVPAAVSAAFTAIYAGEGNTMHGGVNVATLSKIPNNIDLASAAAMAFDEPLTKTQVVAIVQPFFIPTISG